MNAKGFITLLIGLFIFNISTVHAAIVSANSELDMNHSWLVNNGSIPQGLDIVALSTTIESNKFSAVNSADFTNTQTANFQVGNPFSDPPIPVLSRGVDTTINLANGDFAAAIYDYSITVEDEPDNSSFNITRRDIVQSGVAAISLNAASHEAEAYSSHLGGRSYRFDNTSNDAISFNISGLFEASISAYVDSPYGLARSSGGFDMLFDNAIGTTVQYFPIAPYLFNIEDSDLGATVSELFLANSGGISGVSFGGSATAIGDGTGTTASLMAQSRYIFGISLDAGASLMMQTGFRQSNAVEYRPQLTSVAAPATVYLCLIGLVCVLGTRKKCKVHSNI